jgi:hypothetical protein
MIITKNDWLFVISTAGRTALAFMSAKKITDLRINLPKALL